MQQDWEWEELSIMGKTAPPQPQDIPSTAASPWQPGKGYGGASVTRAWGDTG